MDFTREPIIETVITPREGCKLVVRSSKSVGQEEYFVDAVEVVTFGSAIFFRSTERPKPFIVPASDYEVLEVREARIVLKNVGIDRSQSIKIAGGRESAPPKNSKIEERPELEASAESSDKGEGRSDRRKDRRRGSRRRRGREEVIAGAEGLSSGESEQRIDLPTPHVPLPSVSEISASPILSSLLAPPPLISETISRYKEQFKDAFYPKEEQLESQIEDKLAQETKMEFEPSALGEFEISEESEEEIYRERRRYNLESKPSLEEQAQENAYPEKREDT